MNRIDAIRSILAKHKDSFFIFSNGLTSREASFYCGHEGSFYMLHAMGEALSVGMGLVSANANLNVVVIDGDGNALMGASSWVMNKYPNLHHYVLENKTYETTGGQSLPEIIAWPEWCNRIPIDNADSHATPNPPYPDEIWNGVDAWLKKQKGD